MAESLRRIQGFSPETLASLGASSYVYVLIDPRRSPSDPRRYFYAGKGEGNRCFAHAREGVKQKSGEPSIKLKTIREVRDATGHPPPIEIVDHGLSTENAFRLESILIKLLKTEGNAVFGHHARAYCQSAEDFDAGHAAPLSLDDIGASVLLVSLNGGSHSPAWPDIAPGDLDRRVLGDWPVSPGRAASVEYVIGVWCQVVRCVYRTAPMPERFKRFQQGLGKGGRPVYKVRFIGLRSHPHERDWYGRSIIGVGGDGEPKLWTKFPSQRGSTYLATGIRDSQPKL